MPLFRQNDEKFTRVLYTKSIKLKEALHMQQLYFHPTWDRQISAQDRAFIEQLFTETYKDVDDFIMSPTIRVALNHKKELLVTVLVHNFTHHSAKFYNRSVFIQCDGYEEEQTFTIPDLVIAPFTSMPWTFIFRPDPAHESLPLEMLTVEID